MRARYVFEEAWRTITRRLPSFVLATAVQAVCFTLLALFAVVALNLFSVIGSARQQIEVHVFLTGEADHSALENRIRSIASVEATRYVSEEEAMADLRAELGDEASLVEVLESNPLPPSIRVTLVPGSVTPEGLADIESKISLLPGVAEVWSGSQSIARLDRILKLAVWLTLGILVVVSLAVAFIVFQTVENSIVTRLHEIEIMELVGATRAMVRAPFLIEGALQGVVGGVVALLLVFILVRVAATVFPAPVFPAAGIAALNLSLGTVLGLLGAGVALNRIRR